MLTYQIVESLKEGHTIWPSEEQPHYKINIDSFEIEKGKDFDLGNSYGKILTEKGINVHYCPVKK